MPSLTDGNVFMILLGGLAWIMFSDSVSDFLDMYTLQEQFMMFIGVTVVVVLVMESTDSGDRGGD